MYRIIVPAACLALMVSCGAAREPADPVGHWEGGISIAGSEIEIMIDVQRAGETLSASIDIPAQGAFGLPLSDLEVGCDSISFELPSNLGTAYFDGIIDGDIIEGRYQQAGYEGSFRLQRDGGRAGTEQLPYRSVDVEIEGDGYLLAGTLTLPGLEPGEFPGIVLFTGSGAQDRDENVFGFRVFGSIADHLTRNGIAVIRCDDRGVGGSTGATDAATDSVFALDAELMLDFLRSHEEVDSDRIGILGHSEGSTVASMVAADRAADVAFVIGMAGPAIRGYDLLLSQIESLSRMAGMSDEQIRQKQDAQRQIMDAVLSGEDVSDLEALFRSQVEESLSGLTEAELEAVGDLDAYIETAVEQSMAQIRSPWFSSFISHDPADELSRLVCPVLMLYGSFDIQVLPEINAEAAEAALSGNPDYSVVVIEGANHLFQEAVTGSVEEYATLEPEFIDGFLEMITEWILHRVGDA